VSRDSDIDPERLQLLLTRVLTDIHCYTMSPRKRYSFWIDDREGDGLKRVKERDEIANKTGLFGIDRSYR